MKQSVKTLQSPDEQVMLKISWATPTGADEERRIPCTSGNEGAGREMRVYIQFSNMHVEARIREKPWLFHHDEKKISGIDELDTYIDICVPSRPLRLYIEY
jgi:hypothetical protein